MCALFEEGKKLVKDSSKQGLCEMHSSITMATNQWEQ
jgi:hypothetical protein